MVTGPHIGVQKHKQSASPVKEVNGVNSIQCLLQTKLRLLAGGHHLLCKILLTTGQQQRCLPTTMEIAKMASFA